MRTFQTRYGSKAILHRYKTIRWETVAAVASAIAAIVTLVYLARQEAVLKQQVNATYLANLYTEQIHSIAAMEAALREVSRSSYIEYLQEEIFGLTKQDLSVDELSSYQADLKKRYLPWSMDKLIGSSQLIDKAQEVKLLTPALFGKAVDTKIQALHLMNINTLIVLSDEPLTTEGFTKFVTAERGLFVKFTHGLGKLVSCTHKILASGVPLTEDSQFNQCDLIISVPD